MIQYCQYDSKRKPNPRNPDILRMDAFVCVDSGEDYGQAPRPEIGQWLAGPTGAVAGGGTNEGQEPIAASGEKPSLELKPETNAEVVAREKAAATEAEKKAREEAKPTGLNVTADQVDMFNTQGGLSFKEAEAQYDQVVEQARKVGYKAEGTVPESGGGARPAGAITAREPTAWTPPAGPPLVILRKTRDVIRSGIAMQNALYFGDNLEVPHESVKDESVRLDLRRAAVQQQGALQRRFPDSKGPSGPRPGRRVRRHLATG